MNLRRQTSSANYERYDDFISFLDKCYYSELFFIMPLKSFSKYFLGIKVDQEMQK